jgi:hypothetical protein
MEGSWKEGGRRGVEGGGGLTGAPAGAPQRFSSSFLIPPPASPRAANVAGRTEHRPRTRRSFSSFPSSPPPSRSHPLPSSPTTMSANAANPLYVYVGRSDAAGDA